MTKNPLSSFNIYDIFANIVPGVVFLIGFTFPFKLQNILGGNTVSITNILLFILFSFVLGQTLQAIGGWADGDHGFPRFIKDILNEESKSRFEVSSIDETFLLLCSTTFRLPSNFNDYYRLFKLLLAYLEYSGRSRALRMQALYLFSRGIWVSSWLLFLWFLVLTVSIRFEYISPQSLELVNLNMDDLRSEIVILASDIVVLSSGLIFTKIRSEIEEDWITYVVLEFYLDRVTAQQGEQFRQNIQI
ncbi:hypothetical protein [Halorussus caseinilyticus]|uniref:hypothetical protein n=1 Tax=Halorussus caseinilyticus TaxID=3034025 RepID=UPI0023E82AC6|nr:hypothetical protein [Halorussus sp. DT72]